MIHTRTIKLALDGEALPTEFRLFTQGWNDTENGRVLFDAAAAKSVMAAYAEWGVDMMIDLEHQSLDVEPGAADPTARDARGWCKLELRDGELWAVGVTWTPDGAARLQNKTQRYVSPALALDRTTKRVLKMINIAIVAMPATHKTPALVAASIRGGQGMDPELVMKALEALEGGDAKAALDILKQLIASAAGADPSAAGDEPGTESDGAEGVAPPGGMQPTGEKESAIDPKVVADSAAPPGAGANDADEDDEDKPEKKAAYKAMRLMLRRLAGVETFAEAVAQAEIWRASHLALETGRKQLAKERALLESEERRRLAVELIQLKAEFPGTVWADAKAKTLKPRWLNMPIAELRAHVTEQRNARGGKAPPVIQPPTPGNGDAELATLSAQELDFCKEYGTDPKEYARLKARRDGASAPRSNGR